MHHEDGGAWAVDERVAEGEPDVRGVGGLHRLDAEQFERAGGLEVFEHEPRNDREAVRVEVLAGAGGVLVGGDFKVLRLQPVGDARNLRQHGHRAQNLEPTAFQSGLGGAHGII